MEERDGDAALLLLLLEEPGLARTENTHSHLHHLLRGSVEMPPTSSPRPRAPDAHSHNTNSVKHLNARLPFT